MTASKAQVFATKAETIAGWTVKRKRQGEKRVVTVRRGQEAFQFTWAPNETTGRVTFLSGFHKIGGDLEEFPNIRAALRLMAEPEGTLHVIKPDISGLDESMGEAVSSGATPSKIKVQRIPFDPAKTPDDAILSVLEGAKITWISDYLGKPAITREGTIPSRGKHYKIVRAKNDEAPEARILLFYDRSKMTGDGYRAVEIAKITSVKTVRNLRVPEEENA